MDAPLRRTATTGRALSAAPPIVGEVLQSPGRPLDGDTCREFSSDFGVDFSRVRVHADQRASESAQALHSLAYTVGFDIVFAPGRYVPTSLEGRHLLTHELTHVVQQTGAASAAAGRGPLPIGDLTVSHPHDEAEHEAGRAERVVTGGASTIVPLRPIGAQRNLTNVSLEPPTAVQRKLAGPPAASSAWITLPDDARRAVSRSIFDGFSPAQQAEFGRVYTALKKAGYWGAVHDVRYVNLEYHQIDATVSADLEKRLLVDVRFCAVRGAGNLLHRDKASFRQLVPPGMEGLHISIGPVGSATLHLDTVSPVIGRGQSGSCAMGIGLSLEHILRDLLHVRGELPHAPEQGATPF